MELVALGVDRAVIQGFEMAVSVRLTGRTILCERWLVCMSGKRYLGRDLVAVGQGELGQDVAYVGFDVASVSAPSLADPSYLVDRSPSP